MDKNAGLNPLRLGLAAGIVWGVSMFLMTLIAIPTGYAYEWLGLMANIYPGYTISYMGSLVGLIYGFFDGFVGLFVLGWLYNNLPLLALAKLMEKRRSRKK